MSRRKSMAAMMRQADTDAAVWNSKHTVGCPVVLTKDDGSTIKTKTRSQAWNLCGTAVVMVDGIAGGYDLSRIEAQDGVQ